MSHFNNTFVYPSSRGTIKLWTKDKISGGQVLPLYCRSQCRVLNKTNEFSFGFVLLQQDYYHLGLIQQTVDRGMSLLQLPALEEGRLLLHLFSDSLDEELSLSSSRMH